MKNSLSTIALSISFALAAGYAFAQLPAGNTPAVAQAPSSAPAAKKDITEAEVRKVDLDSKKVTLKHGPIKNLDMPGMTMVFQVRDPALLAKLVAGEKVMFSAEQLQGAYVVTAVEKIAAKP